MENIKEKLEIVAKELTRSCVTPTDLYEICRRLNISVTKADLKGQKAIGVFTKDGFEIRVNYHSKKNNNAFDSFVIAHEMGHFILNEKLKILQESTKDYWKQEILCDYFSRLILLPGFHIKSTINKWSESPRDQYKLSLFLSKKFNVNWKTCAHRVSDFKKNIIFFEIFASVNSQDKFFRFDLSTLPHNSLIKTKITRNNKDREYIYNTLSRVIEGKTTIYDIDPIFISHPLFSRFRNWKEGILVKNYDNSIRMVIKSAAKQ